jgi:hypothetical protein
LEDARKAWTSPFENIALINIPKQVIIEDEAYRKFFEGLHFNPWNLYSKDFEPIGNMNRARKVVYEASAAARK